MCKVHSLFKRIFLLVGLVSILATNGLMAQQDLVLYNMEAIPQRMYSNPAFKPSFSKLNIGLPVISSEYLNVGHSGFKYSNLIRHRADDSLYIDYDNMLSNLAKNNYIQLAFQPDILSFGFTVKKNYFSFNATEKINFRFRYPKNFMEFIWKGNGALLDEEVNLNFGINFSHYREYGFGFARDVNDKLTVGGKLKYLHGFSNIWTKKADISLTTESNYFAITTKADVQIYSSGFDSSATNDFDVSKYLKKKNRGAAIDLGGVYKYNEKFSFSASVIDLGFIKWKDYISNYESSGTGEFTYQGIDVSQVLIDSAKIEDVLSALGDSAAQALKFDTTYASYSTWLNTKIYLGANYYVTPKSNAGVLFYSQIFDKGIHPGLALSYSHLVGRWLNVSASYAMYNRSYNNVGFGLSINGGPVQFHVVSDNILGMIFPQHTKNIHLRFGINLTFGRPHADKDKDGIRDKKDLCPDVPGLEEFKGCPDKDKDKITDSKDDCPDIAGPVEFNGCPDKDGDKIIDKKDSCPDIAGPIDLNGCPDRDGDKIMDRLDSCPDNRGLAAFHGCPDSDHDLVIDKLDACPNDSGRISAKGCPDMDADGILDKDDRCPEKVGSKENDGCPLAKLHVLDEKQQITSTAIIGKDGKFTFAEFPEKESPLLKLESFDVLIPNEISVVTGKGFFVARKGADGYFHIEYLASDKNKLGKLEEADVQVKLKMDEATAVKKAMETLEFDKGSEVIRVSSSDGLNSVAQLLVKNPSWKLKLSGHTDNVSSLKYNMNLSKKRVESIKKHLLQIGVPANQIVLKWYGPSKPIASNDTEEGRQKNRRVEFLIIQ